MCFARLALEVESLDDMTFSFFIEILLGHSLRDNMRVICYANNLIITSEFFMDLVGMYLVDLDGACLRLVIKLGFLNESGYKVIDGTIFWNKKIIGILEMISFNTSIGGYMLTTLEIPSLRNASLRDFLVSSSDRLMSNTSKNSSLFLWLLLLYVL